MSNSYLEAAGSEDVSITVLSGHNVLMPLLTQKSIQCRRKSILACQSNGNKPPAMQRVHRAKWNDEESQEQRVLNKLNAIIKLKRPRRSTPHQWATTGNRCWCQKLYDYTSCEPEEIVLPDYPATVEQQPIGQQQLQAEDQQQNLTVIPIRQ